LSFGVFARNLRQHVEQLVSKLAFCVSMNRSSERCSAVVRLVDGVELFPRRPAAFLGPGRDVEHQTEGDG